MFKKIFICMALLVSMHSFGQTVSGSETPITVEEPPKYANFKAMELGYLRSGEANGAYIEYFTSNPFKGGKSAFGFDFGLKGMWNCFSYGDESYHSIGFGLYLGLSAQIKFSEKCALIPTTGLMLNAGIPLFDGAESDFTVGWDVGGRLKFSGGYLGYTCSIPFKKGTVASHFVGIGFDF